MLPNLDLETPWIAPGPKWDEAFIAWDIFWDVHVYFFGGVFTVTSLYSLHRILQVLYGKKPRKNKLELIVLLFALLFSLTRCVILFVDPYHQGTKFSGAQPTRVLWGLGPPCLVATNLSLLLLLLKDCEFTYCGACQYKCQFTLTETVIVLQLTLFVVKDSLSSIPILAEKACQVWFVFVQIYVSLVFLTLAIVVKRKLRESEGLSTGSWIVLLLVLMSFTILIHCGATAFYVHSMGLFDVPPLFIDSWKWWTLETSLRSSEMLWCEFIMAASSKKQRRCLSLEAPDYETFNYLNALANYRNSSSSTEVKSDEGPREDIYGKREDIYEKRNPVEDIYGHRIPREDIYQNVKQHKDIFEKRSPREDIHKERIPREDIYGERSPREDIYGQRSPREDIYGQRSHREDVYGQHSPREVIYDHVKRDDEIYGHRAARLSDSFYSEDDEEYWSTRDKDMRDVYDSRDKLGDQDHYGYGYYDDGYYDTRVEYDDKRYYDDPYYNEYDDQDYDDDYYDDDDYDDYDY